MLPWFQHQRMGREGEDRVTYAIDQEIENAVQVQNAVSAHCRTRGRRHCHFAEFWRGSAPVARVLSRASRC